MDAKEYYSKHSEITNVKLDSFMSFQIEAMMGASLVFMANFL